MQDAGEKMLGHKRRIAFFYTVFLRNFCFIDALVTNDKYAEISVGLHVNV
jgi:hypothetical protein